MTSGEILYGSQPSSHAGARDILHLGLGKEF
jgi:hypothetical protein